jgi:CheY-like chemotaxis protein
VRILVVDDSHSVRARLVALLASELPEAEVSAAASTEAALDLVHARPVDVVVLDLHMPGRDGFALLAALQEAPSVPRVLVLTADATEQHRRACLARGAEALLDKATEFERVVSLIVSEKGKDGV